ncbi:MAG: hypothetical protein ABSH35_36180, partial [Isosphaeraceae bacterium]
MKQPAKSRSVAPSPVATIWALGLTSRHPRTSRRSASPLCYATAKLLRDEAESMVPNIDPEQVRKLAGWGLTQNDRAS